MTHIEREMFGIMQTQPGVSNEKLAVGPGPAFVVALTLNVYFVKGFRSDISIDVASSSTEISC